MERRHLGLFQKVGLHKKRGGLGGGTLDCRPLLKNIFYNIAPQYSCEQGDI